MLALMSLTPDEALVLGRYVPRMGFEVDDLGVTSNADLLARGMSAEATLALSALRDVRIAADVPALLTSWGSLLRAASTSPSGLRALRSVLRYVLEVHGGLDAAELARLADSILHGAGAEIMTTVKQLMDLGRAEGRVEERPRDASRGGARRCSASCGSSSGTGSRPR